jgi:hypothetical protein
MKFSRVTAAIVMASLSSPLFAGAEQSIGTLTAASQGTFIARDGKLVPAFAGQTLYTGDRVVTRDNAKAKVALPGCSLAIAPTSMLSVSPASCASAPTSFAAQDSSGGNEGSGGGGDRSTTYIVAGAAALAVAGGIWAATSHSDSKPASP